MSVANNCRYPDCVQCDRNDCDMDDKDIQAMLKRRRWDKNPEVFREKQREYRKRRYQCMEKPEEKVYQFLVEYISRHMYPPSVREIAVGIGLRSQSNIPEYLERLKDRGLIDGEPKKSRAIRLTGYIMVRGGGRCEITE
ncbi:hypothetical protein [Robinsoniella peoriensis]|uniref:LexA family protein n=1 Tax=Robinsoniella peoriensis TaxID=180332 RepID=UPI00159F1BD5|nr:hypothetical protein [Robinsoniella peoriensis]